MLTFKTEYTSVSIDETTELRDFGITTKRIWLENTNNFIIIIVRNSHRAVELIKHHLKNPDKYKGNTTIIHCKAIETVKL